MKQKKQARSLNPTSAFPQVQNELESQRIATRFAFRKRTHQLEQAHQELQWQIKTVNCLYQCPSHPCLTDSFNSSRSGSICPVRQTQDEINELKEDILRLERDMQSKMAPLKLVHTRLEYRTRRPGTDLCRDEVNVHVSNQVVSFSILLSNLCSALIHSNARFPGAAWASGGDQTACFFYFGFETEVGTGSVSLSCLNLLCVLFFMSLISVVECQTRHVEKKKIIVLLIS